MRKFVSAASAVGVLLALTATASAAASARATTIVVEHGQSIQAAINRAQPGDTILLKPGVYHQSVQIRTDDITLRGSGNSRHDGTVLEPPSATPGNICNSAFGPTGVCLLAKKISRKGTVIVPVYGDKVTDMYVTGFAGNGVFGYGTYGMTVTNVSAVNDGYYGISRFESTATLFANDTAVGNYEAGYYVGDSPDATTVVRDNRAIGNSLGIFVRHARGVQVVGNQVTGNCQGILVLDDGQRGGAGNAVVRQNNVFDNNKFCPKSGHMPSLRGGGILLLGATETTVADNSVTGNVGKQVNSGGIVVLSAKGFSGGGNPNYDTIKNNTAFRNARADIIWDGTGIGLRFVGNYCATSIPGGLCH